jgi:hypothetical protein
MLALFEVAFDSPSPEQPSPLGPRTSHPPPYPHQRTTQAKSHRMSERDIADSDSNVTHPVNEGTLGVE